MPIDVAPTASGVAATEGAKADAATALPEAADVGRRLLVWWAEEAEWFSGVLAAIEAGHDDGGDTGDYHVIYDDGDEQWEPLGSRTQFKWAGERVASDGGAKAKSGSKRGSARKAVRKPRPQTPPCRR